MRKSNKTKLKTQILLMGLMLLIGISAAGQEDFNSTKNWGVSLNYYGYPAWHSISANLLYRQKKNCFFAGYGLRKDIDTDEVPDPESELYLGYRRYPGKNQKQLKFLYQTFLYYSANHCTPPYISNRYMTINIGLGLEYDFAKRFSLGLNSNIGIGFEHYITGHDYVNDGITLSAFPAMVSICYKFKTIK